MHINDLLPWTDRTGRLSALRAVTFAGTALPGVWIGCSFLAGRLGATPWKEATHEVGTWTLYFLLAALAVTPLRLLLAWPALTGLRRMLGVAGFAYAFAHLMMFVGDQSGDLIKVASEIVKRIYLTIGFVAVCGLAVLAATSFDAAVRQLGRSWRRLHRAAYPLTVLGLVHFFLQSRLDVAQPVLLSGIFLGLMLHRWRRVPGGVPGVLLVAVVCGVAAGVLEWAWYVLATGVPGSLVLQANFTTEARIAPMWWTMAVLALPLPVMLARGAVSTIGRPSRA